jgi:hypothetical protein
MTDAIAIPLIIASVAIVIICTGIIHSVNERNPLFILAIILLITSVLVLGLTALLSFLALMGG